TRVHGRGVVPEDLPGLLGGFNSQPAVEQFYATCDAVVVVGSRLRGNETMKFKLQLPKPLYRVDVDALADNRSYPNQLVVHGDARAVLEELATLLEGRIQVDPTFAADLKAAHEAAESGVAKATGPYRKLIEA